MLLHWGFIRHSPLQCIHWAKMLAFNKGKSRVDFIPSAPSFMEKLIYFNSCRRAFEKKLLWQNAELLHLLTGHEVLSPHQQLLILETYWSKKNHSLSVAFYSTFLLLLDLLVITHKPTGSQMSSRFFAKQCDKICSPSKLLGSELQEVSLCS